MTAKSIFDFKFSEKDREEGKKICMAIGVDMTKVEGYTSHEVIEDFGDAGHIVVETVFDTQEHANAVLAKYIHDAKIEQATKLMGNQPTGFLGRAIS